MTGLSRGGSGGCRTRTGLIMPMRSSRDEHLHVNEAVRDGSLLLMENSRAFELEADHLSADWMEAIGRDPQALIRFFEKIAKECGEICDGGSMLAYQPSFSERIHALSE